MTTSTVELNPELGSLFMNLGEVTGRSQVTQVNVGGFRRKPDGTPGPAERAGIKVGDVLVAVNGTVIVDGDFQTVRASD